MSQSLYRSVFKRAWRLTWRAKYLWFFGFFVAVVGIGGEGEIVLSAYRQATTTGTTFPTLAGLQQLGFFSFATFRNIGIALVNEPLGLLLFIILGLLLAGLISYLAWFVAVSAGAITQSAHEGEERPIRAKAALESGIHHGWKTLALLAIRQISIWAILVIIGLPFIGMVRHGASTPSAGWSIVPLLIIFLPLAVIISFVTQYAIAFAIKEGQGVWQAFASGWRLFINHWLVSLETAFLFFILMVFQALVVAQSFILFAYLTIPLSLLTSFYSFTGATYFVVIGGVVLYALLLALFLGILGAFRWASWIFLFERLTDNSATSKIMRLAGYGGK